MKKILLFTSLLFAGAAIAQNVQDQKIAFNYIQLPSDPIKGPKVYSVELNHDKYLAANEDSLEAYEAKIMLAESQLVTWIEQKRKIDQAYLLEMDKWQKTVNAGTPTAQPVKPPYPEMPTLKEELEEPILTTDISEGIVDGAIQLEGFTKGDGGAVIKIEFEGLKNATVEQKVTGTGAAMKYEFYAKYEMPVSVTVEVPGQGIIINENVNHGQKSQLINKYDSEYGFQYWRIDNYNDYWVTLQQQELNSILATINNMINDKCGFPTKSYATEIYTIKKHKGHNYNDLIDAYTKAKSGYDLIYKDISKSDAIAKLKKACAIWEKALAESDLNDNKARINDKVTALIYVNLAEAYMWMNEWSQADNYIQKAQMINTAAGKYKRESEDVEQFMNYLKDRHLANQ
ncbi:hypothetical protein [Parvicella tangerina]|uniref:Tetratricopeptide repeat protein n=1 Tax=Parvicella tangerina TaxID=2829795 RepID=A0A916NFM3_9FLAO|nr:hypothetical protein [Parvicella tangerina]CAG5078881.1 hypothetical protein CRYO30217_00796 [Parvicella tangerina]